MFRVQGVSPPPLLIYRLGIAVLLIILLHSYSTHRSQLEILIHSAKEDLETCRVNSESIFTKLKVIYEHKKKMELQYEKRSNDSERKVTEMRNSLVSCSAALSKTRERINLCEKITTTTSTAEKLKVSAEETFLLQKDEIQRLQNELKEQKEELNRSREQLETVKREADECQKTIKQHVGMALPVAHYTQNETAFFNRKHRVGEELAFDRGVIEHHHGEIIEGDVLMKRLAEKRKTKEEADIHPEDRKENDVYVDANHNDDNPDVAEKDYKEGG